MDFARLLSALTVAGTIAAAQEPLTLREAVRKAQADHPSQQSAAAETRAAQSRVAAAKSGYLPRATLREFYQTSNQPVFAFGSLLNQRRFGASNLAIDALNQPGFVNNFQTQAGFEQTVWDFGATKSTIRSAQLGQRMSEEEQRRLSQLRIAAVAHAYHSVTLAEEGLRVARAGIASAQASLERAIAVRDAGLSTEADVLSMRVHLAAVREQEIRRQYEIEVARAALNEAMGASPDAIPPLATPLTAAPARSLPMGPRPELRQAQLARERSEVRRDQARLASLPRIVARGAFEADRGRFVTQGGANWFFGAGLEWTLFDAGSRHRVEEASQGIASAAGKERETEGQLKLELKRATAAFAAAGERIRVAEAAIVEAEESLRIIRNRFEAGLARVDELLRAETAVNESRLRRLAAIFEQRMGAVAVELASGSLREDSDVLN